MRKSDLLAELADVMSDGVAQDLWILSFGIDNNPWGQYQPLILLIRSYEYKLWSTTGLQVLGMIVVRNASG